MFKLVLSDDAIDDFEQLDQAIAQRIKRRLDWLAENSLRVRHEPMRGRQYTGFYRFRIGNYRVLYELLEDVSELHVHVIGHRRNVYD